VELALHQLATGSSAGVQGREMTDQEIARMLENQDLTNVPKPDPARFDRFLRQRLPGNPAGTRLTLSPQQ